MISKRIIGSVIVKDGHAVQSIGFSRYLPIGSPEVSIEYLDRWGADEIVVLNISGPRSGRWEDPDLLSSFSRKSFVPLTIGGGITSVEEMHTVIRTGADKFVINRAAHVDPNIISRAAEIFGSQCVVVSLDVRSTNGYEVFLDSGKVATGVDPVSAAKDAERRGAGEILLRSIERDGSRAGFDTQLIRSVASAIGIPVVAAGGCGDPAHAVAAFEAGADAVAVGNMLNFTEHSLITLKAQLSPHVPIRMDTHATYDHAAFEGGRLQKEPDAVLEKLRFEYHPKEVI